MQKPISFALTTVPHVYMNESKLIDNQGFSITTNCSARNSICIQRKNMTINIRDGWKNNGMIYENERKGLHAVN